MVVIRLRRALAIAIAVLLAVQPAAAQPVPGDRWLEIDLYWFDSRDIDGSTARFWDRFAPLYAGVSGYRGVVLGIGLTVEFIMDFSGRLGQRMALPGNAGQAQFAAMSGILTGDTAARQAAWHERFAPAHALPKAGYGTWTYADLRRLTDALRREGKRRGIADFRVASFASAASNTYGEDIPFARTHPEAFTRSPVTKPNPYLDTGLYFDPAARLHADTTPRAAFPAGLPEGTPVHAAFAAQWGRVSRAAGFDGLMLRDSFGFARPYTRDGPFGSLTPDPAWITRTTDAVSALVRETKQANPAALLMMYSNGGAASGDWRNNGLDLERIAHEGFVDIFVDQTWAGAWGEVGVRRPGFWNAPDLGWTYQLQFLLQHAAVLADTHVRHYPLTETFDAWESFDIIHTAPERLRWGIWAYSHAAVKTPAGLKVPAGSYISWANQGRRLLSPADVAWLAGTLGDAVRDAAATRDVFGPTVVYSRASAAYEAAHASATREIGQWTDDQVATLAKWPVPILSITRLEWLPRVTSDLFVVGAPANLPRVQLDALTALARAGQPIALLGRFPQGIDPALGDLAGLQRTAATPNFPPVMATGRRGDAPVPVDGVAGTFPVRGDLAATTAAPATIVYTVGDAPGLVLRHDDGVNLSAWDPPLRMYLGDGPLLRQLGGSAAPFALAAATLTAQLAPGDRFRAARIDLAQTTAVAAWRLADGRIRLLAGNLEEGLRDDADQSRHVTLVVPRGWGAGPWQPAWPGGNLRATGAQLMLDLPPEGSMLLTRARPNGVNPP